MREVLVVKNLSKKYPDFLLNDINFNIREGEIVGLVGENGAGKTTLIKLLLNLTSPDSGEVMILGKKYIDDEKYIKNHIGKVFDDNFLHELLTPLQFNYIMSQIYSDWDGTMYLNFLEKFKLPKTKKIGEFSRGMKVKLNVALALSSKPKLLILDEATSGLDPVMRSEILNLLKLYVEGSNSSIIISSHILSDIERIASRVLFIHKGVLVVSDDINKLTKTDNLENIMREYIKEG